MKPKIKSEARRDAAAPHKFFTLPEANRALAFVRPVTQNIVDSYRELMALRQRRGALAAANAAESELAEVQTGVERILERLKTLNEELTLVGCSLKDWQTGLIDFPAKLEDRRVWLCWKLGEADITHWHEWEGGFATRQNIAVEMNFLA